MIGIDSCRRLFLWCFMVSRPGGRLNSPFQIIRKVSLDCSSHCLMANTIVSG
jgi:hypothetical protein